MRCPNCGIEVGESPFCPQCGADLIRNIRRRRVFFRKLDRSIRHITAAGVILITIVSVLMVLLSAVPGETPEETGENEPPIGAIVFEDGSYILADDGFEDIFTISMDPAGQIVFVLNDELSKGYERFRWELRNDLSGNPWVITSKSPQTTWKEPAISDWTLSVCCLDGELEESVHVGSFIYREDASRTYTWSHSNRTLSVSFDIPLRDFIESNYRDESRYIDGLDVARTFVEDSGIVKELEAKIWNSYSTAFSVINRTSTDYAICIISMVDQCLMERDDVIIHGTSTYWATPEETLYFGIGDGADIVVLVASMLKIAGFDITLVHLSDTWAIGIDSVIPSENVPEGYDTLVISQDGKRYAICLVKEFAGIGVMPTQFDHDGKDFLYYGSALEYPYGMVTCRY